MAAILNVVTVFECFYDHSAISEIFFYVMQVFDGIGFEWSLYLCLLGSICVIESSFFFSFCL